ncbi:MAG: DUF503 domain-containing protein [Myxococcota bacterium]
MVVALCEVEFALYEVGSLKVKRKIVRKLVDRVRARFKVSIGEVADQDVHGRARIGFALVGSDGRVLESTLDKILRFMDELYVAERMDVDREIFHWGEL